MAGSATLNLTQFDAALKTFYTGDKVKSIVLEDNPLLALIPKMTKFVGRNMPIPVIIGNPMGVSDTFLTAQTNAAATETRAFTITRAHGYGVALIDNETMEASASDKGAWFAAREAEISGILRSVARSVERKLFSDGTSALGKVVFTTGTDTYFTLADPNDIVNFELNQKLVFGDAPGTTMRATAGYVVAVDYDGGKVYLSATLGGAATDIDSFIASFATNDYAFVEGTNAAVTANVRFQGLRAWIPDAAPAATLFNGLDRTVSPTGLAGIRFDGSALSIEEALQKAAHKAKQFGAKPTHVLMNPVPYGDLLISLGSKVVLDIAKSKDAEIGFEAIVIHTPVGQLKVLSCATCPSTRAFMIKLDSLKLYSMGDVPKILDTDGSRVVRKSDADSVEVRCGFYGQMACNEPGSNVNIKLA